MFFVSSLRACAQVKLDRMRHATAIAQDRNERRRKRVERSLCELRLETEEVATNAVVKSKLQRRVRGLVRDIDDLQVGGRLSVKCVNFAEIVLRRYIYIYII